MVAAVASAAADGGAISELQCAKTRVLGRLDENLRFAFRIVFDGVFLKKHVRFQGCAVDSTFRTWQVGLLWVFTIIRGLSDSALDTERTSIGVQHDHDQHENHHHHHPQHHCHLCLNAETQEFSFGHGCSVLETH